MNDTYVTKEPLLTNEIPRLMELDTKGIAQWRLDATNKATLLNLNEEKLHAAEATVDVGAGIARDGRLVGATEEKGQGHG